MRPARVILLAVILAALLAAMLLLALRRADGILVSATGNHQRRLSGAS